MSRTSLKFLHLADLHLDCPLVGGRLKLPFEKAERRGRDQREALTCAVALAQKEKVDIILIAGDLWEEETLAPDTVPFVMETLGRASVLVVIAPGNHDYFSPGSHYSSEITAARFGRSWPENVVIFRDYNFSHLSPPGLDGVSVTGLAYRSNQAVSTRRLREKLTPPEADIRLAVIHASREEQLPPGKMKTLPFKDAELLSQPFDYVALGHYHSRSEIRDDSGKLRAAYPGSLCAVAADETGEHGVLVGTVKPGGVEPEGLEFHRIDPRRVHRLSVDISGLQHVQAVESRIMVELTKGEVRRDDMALVELSGTYPQGSRIPFNEDFLTQACFHLQVDTGGVRPEWDIESEEGGAATTEGLFRARLRQMIAEAAERGDQDEVARLQNALYYGLDALYGKPITPRQTG